MMMKKTPILNMMKNSLLDIPSPTSISYAWNMGFLLGMVLMTQIVTGLLASMLFIPETDHAFTSVMMMSRDNQMGWATRFIHSNGASLFFILLYIHTSRGIYFTSPQNQSMAWISGVTLLLMAMATAFLGYVLPWGQMSFWGATVITGVLSAIPMVGSDLTIWIWGGPSVAQPTLNRFFSLHFILPMLISATVILHLMLLHTKGSSSPSNTQMNMDKMKFHPIYTIKDILPLLAISMCLLIMISNKPNILSDVENFNMANPLSAPIHIQPEWYFLFAYVILRSIPSKAGGAAALAASILILMIVGVKKTKSTKFLPGKKIMFWTWISVVLILTWIGGKTVEPPFESIGQMYTILYFSLMILL